MSDTAAQAMDRVWKRIGDVRSTGRIVSPSRLLTIVQNNMHLIASRTHQPRHAVVTVNLVAGTYDYSLSLVRQSVTQVLLGSTGLPLAYLPFSIFNEVYAQETSGAVGRGSPIEYTLWEGENNATRIRVGPTPAATDTLKVHGTTLPDALTGADFGTIPFSHELLAAVELASAAECVEMLAETDLSYLHLSRSVAGLWRSKSDEAVQSYNQRILSQGARQDRVIRYAPARAIRIGG